MFFTFDIYSNVYSYRSLKIVLKNGHKIKNRTEKAISLFYFQVLSFLNVVIIAQCLLE